MKPQMVSSFYGHKYPWNHQKIQNIETRSQKKIARLTFKTTKKIMKAGNKKKNTVSI